MGPELRKKLKEKYSKLRNLRIFQFNFFLQFGKKETWLCSPQWDPLVLLMNQSAPATAQGLLGNQFLSYLLSGCVFLVSYCNPLSSDLLVCEMRTIIAPNGTTRAVTREGHGHEHR